MAEDRAGSGAEIGNLPHIRGFPECRGAGAVGFGSLILDGQSAWLRKAVRREAQEGAAPSFLGWVPSERAAPPSGKQSCLQGEMEFHTRQIRIRSRQEERNSLMIPPPTDTFREGRNEDGRAGCPSRRRRPCCSFPACAGFRMGNRSSQALPRRALPVSMSVRPEVQADGRGERRHSPFLLRI